MSSSTSPRDLRDRRRLAALWSGVLAGPLVWLALLETNYVLSYVACETRHTWFLHLGALVAIVIVAAAGIRAWRAAVDDPLTPDQASAPLGLETSVQRVRWLALAAAILSAGFVLLIVATELPVFVLQVCD